MTTANKITFTRIGLIPFFIALLYISFPGSDYVALGLFLLISLTDFLDGYVARKYSQVSTLGKFLDPLADKLLITAALIPFVERGSVSGIVVFVIISRELIITTLRIVAMSQGKVMAAGMSGKIKTCVQIGTVSLLLVPPLAELALIGSFTLGQLAGWIAAAVTVWSGAEYLYNNRSLFGERQMKG